MISIETEYDNSAYTPGDTVSGKVRWQSNESHTELELRLFWFTEGRGSQDVGVIESRSWPATQGEADFSFVMPSEPYSFSGKLVSLTWGIEAVLLPDETSQRKEITLSPDGQLIELTPVDSPATEKKWSKWFRPH